MHRRNIPARSSLIPLLALLAAAVITASRGAEVVMLADSNTQDLAITASFANQQSVSPREDLVLTLSHPLAATEGSMAVLIGSTDVTSLLITRDTSLVYSPRVVPLPTGETQVLVYLVSAANTWTQLAQFTLRVQGPRQVGSDSAATSGTQPNGGGTATTGASSTVPTARKHGFDKANFTPSITIGMKSQAAESHFPETSRPPRPTFADMTLQGSVRSDLARGAFNSQTQFDVVGSSFKQEALRFATERDGAPNIDLASYLMQFQIGKAKLSVGHIAFGTNRHLINNFSSRGISITTPISKYADVSLAAMNGTSIVGWSNFLGVSRTNHQFVTGTAGFEFIPERRGELRFELSVLDGQLQPVSSFNQGSITDTEQSRGLGLRFLGVAPSQRWRFDGGFTRSRFTNPADPLLSQGFNVVAVRESTRDARYFDGAFNVIQNARLSETKRATITLNYKHENVDPLFRSVAAITQPDRSQNEIDVIATIGEVTATVTHLRFNDNLANVPSVLKSLTRRSGLIFGTPLSALFGSPKKPSPWLPRVSYSVDELHQFGASIPVNGGFELNPSTVPDQVSTNQSLSADWQVKTVRWGYRFNRSFQDNRQVGRELADLRNITNVWSLGIQPNPRLGINLDAGWDSAFNKEQKRTDQTLRLGPSVNWTMTKSMVFTGMISATSLGNVAGTSRTRDAEADLQWSYRFAIDKGRNKKVQGQFFIRYADRYGFARDTVFGFRNLTKLRTLNGGINFTFF
jgi:hypothetical protein